MSRALQAEAKDKAPAQRNYSVLLILALHLVASFIVNATPAQETPLYPVVRQAKTGFIDRQANLVIEPQFDAITLNDWPKEFFSEGLQPVARDLKWGYVDGRGAVRIPLKFSMARPFFEGLAAVQVEGKYGYIDHSGTLKIPAVFDDAGPFSEGVAWVMRSYKVGYIDKKGSLLVQPQFASWSAELSSFSEGLAGACQKGPGGAPGDSCLWGFIDKAGGWMIPPRYKAISAFHEGLAVVHQEGESQSKYIDHSGKTVAGPFNLAWEFSEGLARVHLPDGRSAFIDREGKVQCTLDKQVSWVEPFADGMAKATTLTEPGRVEKIGYIDRSGRFAIPPVYEAGSSFRNGLALVYSCNQSGYVGKNGEAVWGIKPRSRVAQAQATPPAAALTAERIAKIAGHPGPLILEVSPVSGACDGFGKKLWSLAVKSTDGTFPAFTINLLEGGTFLSDEMVGNLKGLQEKLRGFGDTSNSFIRPIGPAKKPIGYASVPGVGPGGSLTVASVFSVDQQYEVQVMLGQGGRDRPLKDPVEWTSKVALDVLSALFETGK